MIIKFHRRFSRQIPWSINTVFKLFDFNNKIANEDEYEKLKQVAIEALKNENQLTFYKQNLVSKKIQNNSFLNILNKGEQAFNTDDPLQNVLNMLTIINGYTMSLVPIDRPVSRFNIDYLDGKCAYSMNEVAVGEIFNPSINGTQSQRNNLLFLESIDEADFLNYLNSITMTTDVINKIFNFMAFRKILSTVANNVDTASTAEIDWTTEGWDQFGETSLIRKSQQKTIKCHI
ncbi:hypothetical protein EG856_02190 [Mycoplasmopsis phocirhinis]|uniref:Uncharacterized protein n=1 Tax=Mycoplasmopsis phocirhinis TaxID=142650 RepID=A0A4P6MTM5_9BACT|nr:hypothetical protein [Mycoplasmopsis phocirhinis]QBF34717.1 hypothetical protein EG856_02190 [Mycoplasmopsis phocirhinis]